ncbi:MAG: hydrogenase maturation protease [Cyanobacteria bacterium]|nr:hydrogenase maturation protease [Cyanobacteriota bacterium]MDA0866546.1 hydrogenase maturation protease [Cyanobacteriota bacterium]
MQPKRWLIIGYGNTLRGDDGVGQQVAVAVADWDQPQIQTLAVHQLTPDLAAEIAPFPCVVFVDAALSTGTDPTIALEKLDLNGSETFTTHIASPPALLALAHRLYDASPTAYLLTIPAVNFDLGEGLSAIATAGKAQALAQLRELCVSPRPVMDPLAQRDGAITPAEAQPPILGAALAEPNRLDSVGLHSVPPNRREATVTPGRGHGHA